jgi:hypothetical protein
MKIILIGCLVLCITACQSMTTTTGYPGLDYGDSIEEVAIAVGERDRIIQKDDSNLVAIGVWELTKDCRKKIFVFYPGQGLQQIKYEPAPELSVANNCE